MFGDDVTIKEVSVTVVEKQPQYRLNLISLPLDAMNLEPVLCTEERDTGPWFVAIHDDVNHVAYRSKLEGSREDTLECLKDVSGFGTVNLANDEWSSYPEFFTKAIEECAQ